MSQYHAYLNLEFGWLSVDMLNFNFIKAVCCMNQKDSMRDLMHLNFDGLYRMMEMVKYIGGRSDYF